METIKNPRKGKYKMRFTGVTPLERKKTVYDKKGFLGISINNDFFWGKHLFTLLNWVNQRFPDCLVIIGGELHRFNEMIFTDSNECEALDKGIELGKKMQLRVDECLSIIGHENFTIHHWNKYWTLERVKTTRKTLDGLFDNNQQFRNDIVFGCKEFIDRKVNQHGKKLGVSKDKAIDLSIQYVLEEISVFDYLIEEGYLSHLYPGQHLAVLKNIASGEYPDISLSLHKAIYADLKATKKR